MNMFEYATMNKLRFSSSRGELSVENLWDVPLRSRDGFDLNSIAKRVNQNVKELTEESFVDTVKTPQNTRAEISLELVKHVIEQKLEAENKAKKRAENKQERDKLLAILAEKQEGKLSKLSEEELHKRIAQLEMV